MKRTLQLALALSVCLPALARAQVAPFVYDGGTLPTGKADFAVQPTVPANQKIVASEWNAVMADVYDVRTAIWPGGIGFGFKTLQAPLASPDGGSSLFVMDGGAGQQPTLNWQSPNGTVTQLGGIGYWGDAGPGIVQEPPNTTTPDVRLGRDGTGHESLILYEHQNNPGIFNLEFYAASQAVYRTGVNFCTGFGSWDDVAKCSNGNGAGALILAPENNHAFAVFGADYTHAISTALIDVDNNGNGKLGGNVVPVFPDAASPIATRANHVTLSTGSATVTFATAFSATPECTCTDQTSAAAVKCVPSTTTVTITGSGSDVISWICAGNK